MNFTEQKQQITSLLEIGDLKIIAERAGVTYQTVYNTHKMESMEKMTPLMLKVWGITIDFLIDRKKKRSEIEQKTETLIENV